MKRWRFALLLTSLLVVVASCGGDSSEVTSAASDPEATALAASQPSATEAPATEAPPASEGTVPPDAGGDGTEIEVIGLDEAFDTREITVKAGEELTVIFNNKDTSGEPHNIHFRTPTEDFFTTIEQAPDVQELSFTIAEPGEYSFFCDTHTDTMTGTLIVAP